MSEPSSGVKTAVLWTTASSYWGQG